MKKILIADDSLTVRKIIEMLLKPFSYDLIFAETGKDAMTKALNMDIDLMVIDYSLPDTKGTLVSKELKKQKPMLPVLLMISSKEEFPAQKMQEGDCDDVVEKPFDSQTFLNKFNLLLEKPKEVVLPFEKEKIEKVEEIVLDKEPFMGINIGEEFIAETKTIEQLVPDLKASVETEVSEEIEVIEDIEELIEEVEEKTEGIKDEQVVETKIEDITLEDLLEKEFKSEDIVESAQKGFELSELIVEEESHVIEEKKEEPVVKEETFEEGKMINIDEFFSDLNQILQDEKEVKKTFTPEKEIVKPVIEEVAKDLKEIEMIKEAEPEMKIEIEKQEVVKEESFVLDEDIWNFDLEVKPEKPAQEIKPELLTSSINLKQIEEMVREITYDIVEKIAWEIVPEIVDTIMKDKFGKQS